MMNESAVLQVLEKLDQLYGMTKEGFYHKEN